MNLRREIMPRRIGLAAIGLVVVSFGVALGWMAPMRYGIAGFKTDTLTVTGLSTLTGGAAMPFGAYLTEQAFSGSFGANQFATQSQNYGTPGTLTGVTASTTIGLTSITLSVGHGITNGQYVTIGAMPGAFVLSAVGATSATLSRPATSSLVGATVQYIQLPDPQVFAGYNFNALLPSEPEWGQQFEANYLDPTGYTKAEAYWQYYTGAVGVVRRPLFAQVNKTLGLIDTVNISDGYEGLRIYGGIGDGATDAQQAFLTTVSGFTSLVVGPFDQTPPSFTKPAITALSATDAGMSAVTVANTQANIRAHDNSGSPYAELTANVPLWLGFNTTIGFIATITSGMLVQTLTDTNGITVQNNHTARTAGVEEIVVNIGGTTDTTGGTIAHYGIFSNITGTRSAGAAGLVNVGGYFSASGGQTNDAIYTGDGDVQLNGSSGVTYLNGVTRITNSGHLRDTVTAPTLSAGCGTGATISGGNDWFTVTTNATAIGTCTITLHNALSSSTPTCIVSDRAATPLTTPSHTCNGTTVTLGPTGLIGGDIYDVFVGDH